MKKYEYIKEVISVGIRATDADKLRAECNGIMRLSPYLRSIIESHLNQENEITLLSIDNKKLNESVNAMRGKLGKMTVAMNKVKRALGVEC